MTLVTYDYESATPSGTALTTGNTGASVASFGTGTAVSDNTTDIWSGSLCGKYVAGSNSACLNRFLASSSNLTMSFGGGFEIDAQPANSITLMTIRGSGLSGSLRWTTTNGIAFVNAAGTILGTMVTGATPGAKYWVSIRVTTTATSNTSTYTVNVYDSTGTSVGSSVTGSGANLGTTAYTGGDFGIVDTLHAAGVTVRWDNIQFNDGSTTEITPPPSSAPATAAATLTFTGTAPSSSAASATATLTLTGVGVAATPPPSGNYDIFVGLIQSNMRGRADDFDYPTTDFYRPNVYYWDPNTNSIAAAAEPAPVFESTPYMGPMNRFSRAYVDAGNLTTGRAVLLVNLAWGGTGLSLPDGNAGNKTWWVNETATHTALDATALSELDAVMAAVGTGSVIKGFLANHGSTDGTNGLSKATFEARLTDCINEFQAYVYAQGYAPTPYTKYILMQMRPDLLGQSAMLLIDQGSQEIAASLPGVGYALSPVGSTYYRAGDTVHFNAAGVRQVGYNLYAQWSIEGSTGLITFTGTAGPAAPSTAAATLTFSGTAAPTAPGTGSATITFAGTGTAVARATPAATVTFTGAATDVAVAGGSATVTFAGTGNTGAFSPATATATLTFAATATARAAASSSATVTLTGAAVGAARTPAAATVTFTAVGTATGGGGAPVRDITVTVSDGPSRHPLVTAGPRRWDL